MRFGQEDQLNAPKIISCTEAGSILGLTKQQVRELVEKNKLTNYGLDRRYMVSEKDVIRLKGEMQ